MVANKKKLIDAFDVFSLFTVKIKLMFSHVLRYDFSVVYFIEVYVIKTDILMGIIQKCHLCTKSK